MKYKRNDVIVNARQAGDYTALGMLGNLATSDWIVSLANGDMGTMDNTSFTLMYSVTSESAALVGTYWD